MIPLVLVVALLCMFVLRYLRNKVIVRKSPLPDEFTPDYAKAYAKFGKQQQERLKVWQKVEEEKLKYSKGDIFGDFDKDMEYTKAKAKLEREHPIRKLSVFEGALALADQRIKVRERKLELAKLKREIFERVSTKTENETTSSKQTDEACQKKKAD